MNFFDQTHYHEINDARLRHLESLKLDLTNKKSIELQNIQLLFIKI